MDVVGCLHNLRAHLLVEHGRAPVQAPLQRRAEVRRLVREAAVQAGAGLDIHVARLAEDGHAAREEIAPADGSGERGDVLAPGAAGLGDRPQRVLRRPAVDGKVEVEPDRPLHVDNLRQSLAVQNKQMRMCRAKAVVWTRTRSQSGSVPQPSVSHAELGS